MVTKRKIAVLAGVASMLCPTGVLAGGNAKLTGEFSPEAWQFMRDWEEVRAFANGGYDHALRFAECVSSYNAAAPASILSRPIGDSRYRSDLVRLASRYRGCGTRVTVPPLLLRAAFAELSIRQGAVRAGAGTSYVGVPANIKSFPVAALAACQLRTAPGLIQDVLSTRPGEMAEEIAVKRLFASTPRCTSLAKGSITPTAARLALIDAAYSIRD
ncbi:hypothetical protein G7077_13390 [Sphingomonas piscis]|uniref:Lytic transglycosylase n=1 Tax=Sphingomonas piscis TaxID=2714943 RepID=A0A6G7YSN5_9SPHN|nr:hypothetical protein [Sphingomonas piscis]QIK79750.1 hypothetical protein G7077_13390 [Sphingomonas piscis]